MLKIIQHRHTFFLISGLLMAMSIISLLVWGLRPGIDFTGGSLVEVSFTANRPEISQVEAALADLNLGEIKVQPAGEKELILRARDLTEAEHQSVLNSLEQLSGEEFIQENRFESIGPVIGQELKNKAWIAILAAILAIVAYIAYSFRHVSKPVQSWQYGLAAIIALIHDIIIIAGIFSVLGYFRGTEVGILFVTALLTILGYSVNDTIVVFDRIRENLIYRPKDTFINTINHSVNETMARSINTSLTVLLVLLSLYFLGGASIKEFSLALIFGVILGTYSSIFIASAMLAVWWQLRPSRSR